MRLKREIIRVLIVATLVTAIWCGVYHRYSVADWKIPNEYSGDSLFVLAYTKAAQEGQYWPILPKLNRYLGAPFVANWNDFPLSEDAMFSVTGMFARVIGLAAAVNLCFMAGCVLAAVTFYLVGRYLRWRWEWCLVGGTIFGLSSFSYFRNIWHPFYVHYWHLPLYLLVCWWAGSKKGLVWGERRYLFAVAVAILTGSMTVYYTNFFLQLLGLATLSQVVRRSPRSKILGPAGIILIAIAAFFLAAFDTLFYAWQHGPNPNCLVRNYSQIDHYGLYPIELLLPRLHRWRPLQDLANYYSACVAGGHVLSEMVYLGAVGAIGLVLLLGSTVLNIIKRPPRPEVLGLQAIWMIAAGTIGGLNSVLGLAGFPLFHAMNRVSIIVLALSLFFLLRGVSYISRHWPSWLCLAAGSLVILLAVADQIPANVTSKDIQKVRTQVEADRNFVEQMEAQLPRGAMVFQLPVATFPEAGGQQLRMGIYESFRPYIYSRELRFSHGTCKGREDDTWQLELNTTPAPELVEKLERYGFSAICINRRAYADNGAQLLDALRAAGRGRMIRNNTSELVCVFLEPAAKPVLPELLTDYRKGWHSFEKNELGVFFAWSKGSAPVTIDNLSGETLVRYLNFTIASRTPRNVEMKMSGQSLWRTALNPSRWENVSGVRITLPPGKTVVDFVTDSPAIYFGGKDPRKVAFAVAQLRFSKDPPPADKPEAGP